MKLWDAPESNSITTGLLWIDNVPIISGAPSGSSARVVKLTRPCLTRIICLLPLLLLFWLEPWPWFWHLGCGQSWAKWVELPQLKHQYPSPGQTGCGEFGLRLVCWGAGGLALPCCFGGLITQRPCWGAFWRAWAVVFYTMRYLCGRALEGPTFAFLFFSARWHMIQYSWVMARLTSSLYVSTWMGLRRSLSLVLRPLQKWSCFLASMSAW